MATTAPALGNEKLDQLCYRVLGTTAGGVVEAALALNPGMAFNGEFLAEGTVVILPDVPSAKAATLETVSFWD